LIGDLEYPEWGEDGGILEMNGQVVRGESFR